MSHDAKQPNKILSEPATLQACAGDLRTRREQTQLAVAADAQRDEGRQHTTETVGAKALGRRR